MNQTKYTAKCFYSLSREGSSSTVPCASVQATRRTRFYSLSREGSSSTEGCESSDPKAAPRVSIRFLAKGLRQPTSRRRHHVHCAGFYSLSREGSSSTAYSGIIQQAMSVSIRFLAKGLRQLPNPRARRTASARVSIRFLAKGLRQRSSFSTISQCPVVSIRFLAKGLRQRICYRPHQRHP